MGTTTIIDSSDHRKLTFHEQLEGYKNARSKDRISRAETSFTETDQLSNLPNQIT